MTIPPRTLTSDQVAQLLQAGHAEPLLPGHFPVPVLLEGRWWHMSAARGDPLPGVGAAVYEPAAPAVAALFARQHARLATARLATARSTAARLVGVRDQTEPAGPPTGPPTGPAP